MRKRVETYLTVVFLMLLTSLVGVYFINLIYGGFAKVKVFVSTTTSLYETGLLERLASEFSKYYPDVRLAFIVVGSGEALERASRGDVCLVLSHAPSLEVKYVGEGSIYKHVIFAYNYFVLVGPEEDPAGVSKALNVVEAFAKIFEAGEEGLTTFVSRGDKSGTNVKELQLWSLAGLNPLNRSWYKNCGCGMSQALIISNQLGSYVLSDISTFLKMKRSGLIPHLKVFFSNSTELINVYSAYISSKCGGEELKHAEEFLNFLTSDIGQELIANYGVEEYGQQLFHSVRGGEERLLAVWEQLSRG
ncbi:MAG: tungsten ABC transporter permease [Zestosphaera tikiterensis]|uniref:Tungsten ABC transporter permease n=1 Tax=Zestosphaera tikiterensis TaxID=1973259 RepID=A0A2R7Y8G4_9CREN|nr:MAG: tungsten ABC transporter permease [Zestosphaera tikiterensis]